MKRLAIHSVPRSGSTWIGSIFDSCPNVAYRFQPLFSYSHKNQLNENSSLIDIQKFYDDILNTVDDFVLQKEAISKNLVPSFEKTNITHVVYKEVRYHNILNNLLEKDNDIKVVGIIRNPLAVINSWLNAPKEFKKELEWNPNLEWRYAPHKNEGKPEEYNGYEKWKETAYLFRFLQKKHPDRFYLVKYDDLLGNMIKEIENIFNFCGLMLSEQTISFLNQSRNIDKSDEKYSVYRIKNVDTVWQNELPRKIIEEIREDLMNSVLKQYI
ncbi:MAG: sulfotransferase domain-containing protein [Bacteroidota bacterium]